MVLIGAALLLLTACWSFGGWMVGDANNIRWIRHWCGGTFVILVAVLSCGAGFLTARTWERSDARESTSNALQAIAAGIESGNGQYIARKLRAMDYRGDPDADAHDLLAELPTLTAELQRGKAVAATARSASRQ